MLTQFAEDEITYTGDQLRSLWAFRTFGLQGDSIVAFLGPCDVRGESLVDVADQLSGAQIASPRMLHFIAEHFDGDLRLAIARQRLLVCLAKEELQRRREGLSVERRGDDLYVDGAKLSVSIATCSPVSALIHLGLNVLPAPDVVPLATCGLEQFALPPRQVGQAVAERYAAEMEDMQLTRCKVRPVD